MGIFRSSQGPQGAPAPQSLVAVGTRVRIAGETGTYVVVRVDLQRYTADLMLLGQPSRVESGVRFQSLHPLPNAKDESSEALERLAPDRPDKMAAD